MRQVQHVQEEKIGNFFIPEHLLTCPRRRETESLMHISTFLILLLNHSYNNRFQILLVTIINLNAFYFFDRGTYFFVYNQRITGSFSIISNKMKEVNLSKMNEQISWNRNDEIGVSYLNYNKMVAKLGDSAALLAKSEREGAWREMARQVAHEIKKIRSLR